MTAGSGLLGSAQCADPSQTDGFRFDGSRSDHTGIRIKSQNTMRKETPSQVLCSTLNNVIWLLPSDWKKKNAFLRTPGPTY